jgi:gliding motility-associated-like protein
VAYRPEARLAVPDSSQCARETFTLINQSVDTVTHPTLNAIDDLRLYFDGVLLASGLALDTVLFTASNAGDFPVELVALNDLGCVDTARRDVVVHPVPLADAGAEARVCQGAAVSLDGSGTQGASSWSWSPADLVSNPSAAVTTAVLTGGDVMFYLNAANGFCASVDSVQVRMIEELGLVPGPDAEICRDGSVPLSAQVNGTVPGISWIWTPAADLSDPTSLNPVATPSGDAAYTITATCGTLEEAATIFVDILEPPTVEASADTTLLILGSTVQLVAEGSGGNGALELWWAQNPDLSCTDCPNPLVTPQQDGWYLVNVVDEAGCADVDSIFLRVFTDCLGDDFELGKAFTPNGDGANDKMEYRSETIGVLEQFRVWNRWGELVFETNDRTEFWDGTFRGKPMDPAVFAFTIQGVCINGENFLRTGDITLIR